MIHVADTESACNMCMPHRNTSSVLKHIKFVMVSKSISRNDLLQLRCCLGFIVVIAVVVVAAVVIASAVNLAAVANFSNL